MSNSDRNLVMNPDEDRKLMVMNHFFASPTKQLIKVNGAFVVAKSVACCHAPLQV